MEVTEKPSLLMQYITTLMLILMMVGAFVWFGITLIDTAQQIYLRPTSISFNKGVFYMFGAGIGLGVLVVAMITEVVLKKHLSKRLNAFLTKVAISGVIIIFLLPQVVHYLIADYLEGQGYEVCHEASHQWLHSRTIVFVNDMEVCLELANKK